MVICDIPSFPLKAAKLAHLPSILVGNFTWYDIYSELHQANRNSDLIQILHEEYSSASIHFLPQFALENDLKTSKRISGFMSLKGNSVHNQLETYLKTKWEHKTLIFIYLGIYDSSSLLWHNLEKLADCLFITRDVQARPPRNLHVLDERFSYSDLIATADIVVTKFGYSTLACAFHHGKPVIACDRKQFCEGRIIRQFLTQNQTGVVVSKGVFNACDWGDAIKQARRITVKDKVRLNGENDVFEAVGNLLGTSASKKNRCNP